MLRAVVAISVGLGLFGLAVTPNGNALTSARPLLDASQLMQHLYAAVVTASADIRR